MYSEAFKENLLRKMMGPNARSATKLGVEVGIPQQTLSRWLREARSLEPVSKPKTKESTKSKKWTAQEKLRVVHEASQLSEEELGEYLRRDVGSHDHGTPPSHDHSPPWALSA